MFNLGNISRGILDPAYSLTKKYTWDKASCSQIVNLISGVTGHYLMCCEAGTLQTEAFLSEMRKNAWQLLFSRDGTLCIGHRGTHANMEFILDRTEADKPDRAVWYLMAEITWGRQPSGRLHQDEVIRRSGLATTRFCVFHIHNKEARIRCGKVREQLAEMMMYCVKYEIDIIGGDANAGIYRYFKNQCPHISSKFVGLHVRKNNGALPRLDPNCRARTE